MVYGLDTNHSIYFREGAIDRTNYYQYGGTLSGGKGHRFMTGGVKASQTEKMQIANDGVRIKDGLSFGTDTAAANQLDDYEEGTWTAVMKGHTGSAGSYATSTWTNTYTKIGNRVFVHMYGYITNKGSWTGQTRIYGLPYTNTGTTTALTVSAFADTEFGTGAGRALVGAAVEASADHVAIFDGSRLDARHDWADVGTGYYVNISGHYKV
jgi:hypothetical protein